MTLEQLRIFAAVAEHRHMTRAAEALGMSQSGASVAVKALEDEFGVQLFNRVGRGIELSHAGLAFLPEARAVLERMATARQRLENVSHRVAGSLSIAASQTIASYWLPTRLATFHEKYPEVRLHVTAANTRQVEAAVLEGSADLGLVEGRVESGVLKRRKVDVDRMAVVTGRSGPDLPLLPSGAPDLRAVHWIIRESGSGTRDALGDLAARFGAVFEDIPIFLVLPTNEAVRQAVEAGAGVSIMSEHVVARWIAAGTLRQIPPDIPPRDFILITHRDREASTALLALKQHFSERPERES